MPSELDFGDTRSGSAKEWMTDALCAQTDPDAFFPELGESPQPGKRICGECDVRPECLAWAIRNREQHGIWGGMSLEERRRFTRQARDSMARPHRVTKGKP